MIGDPFVRECFQIGMRKTVTGTQQRHTEEPEIGKGCSGRHVFLVEV